MLILPAWRNYRNVRAEEDRQRALLDAAKLERQQQLYMDSFNKEKNYHLVNAGGIHVEPVALYSKKVTSVSALAEGAREGGLEF